MRQKNYPPAVVVIKKPSGGTIASIPIVEQGRFVWPRLRSFVSMWQFTTSDEFQLLNHNLAYCYNNARVIKWLWANARNRFQGGGRSFED